MARMTQSEADARHRRLFGEKRIREGTGAGETVATRPTGSASPAPAQAHRKPATNVRSDRTETDGRGPRQISIRAQTPANGQKRAQQPVRKPAPPSRGMNKLESRYAQHLELLKRAGEVRFWAFESIRLRLADGAWFKPDFVVIRALAVMEFHETKGFMREAANVRIKVAADRFPFRFFVVRADGKGWKLTKV